MTSRTQVLARSQAGSDGAAEAGTVDPHTVEPGTVEPGTADLVYFSSVSGNTHRFITKLGRPALRIPIHPDREPPLRVVRPYVLVVPSYGGGDGSGSVPRQVVRFLNDPHNRSLIRGVIGAGNTNFGEAYCRAGDIIAGKCGVPHLYRFEVFGTADDVRVVAEGLDQFWTRQ